jgi:threonine aldolase
MSDLHRREFLVMGALAAAAGLQVSPVCADAVAGSADQPEQAKDEDAIRFHGDGLSLTPVEYADLLRQLARTGQTDPDYYSRGGVVEQLEQNFAGLLGKERAVFMPTGTLANHLAVRLLSGERRRVAVQAESHLYNDSGDCAQTLSGLNLVPLGPGEATFTLEDLKAVLNRTEAGRVRTGVGAISIESPVRRRDNAMFDWAEMQRVSAFARGEGIGLHLDGARLPLASVHTGIPWAEFAGLFDTVYVSLYKCFNAASGAILAGPAELIDGLYHTRRMFGGGMPQVWPFAAVALHYLDGFAGDYARALAVAEDLLPRLASSGQFQIDRVPNGTSVFRLRPLSGDPEAFRLRLLEQNIHLGRSTPEDGTFVLRINPSLGRSSAEELARAFTVALGVG